MSQPIYRVPISLPCTVPVVPGTPDAGAPIGERTETCNVNAWWVIGRAPICHRHLNEGADGAADELAAEMRADGADVPNATERTPWAEQHRYEQNPALLFEGHPVRVAWEAARG